MKQFYALMVGLACFACSESIPSKPAADLHNDKPKQTTGQPEAQSSTTHQRDEHSNRESTSTYRYEIMHDQTGYGYQIFDGQQLIVSQPHIPAIQGLKGFQSQHDAEKVAELMLQKLNKGIVPPTVSIQEMRDLGIVL